MKNSSMKFNICCLIIICFFSPDRKKSVKRVAEVFDFGVSLADVVVEELRHRPSAKASVDRRAPSFPWLKSEKISRGFSLGVE